MRIYVDESGTHAGDWLVIGMLFVPDHGPLHSQLCAVKEKRQYLNRSPKRNARYKESHLADFRSQRDADVAKDWIDVFLRSTAFYRCVVIDWSIWKGKFFGNPFEPEALKKRRAYKKWAEMLLQPEAKSLSGAKLYLDKLLICYGYDVISELEGRFTRRYQGETPRIAEFQTTDSWRDANQCLQLCDILVGCVYQKLVPSKSAERIQTVDYLYTQLVPLGVKSRDPSFWRGYAANSLTSHFPKFSEWYWRPS